MGERVKLEEGEAQPVVTINTDNLPRNVLTPYSVPAEDQQPHLNGDNEMGVPAAEETVAADLPQPAKHKDAITTIDPTGTPEGANLGLTDSNTGDLRAVTNPNEPTDEHKTALAPDDGTTDNEQNPPAQTLPDTTELNGNGEDGDGNGDGLSDEATGRSAADEQNGGNPALAGYVGTAPLVGTDAEGYTVVEPAETDNNGAADDAPVAAGAVIGAATAHNLDETPTDGAPDHGTPADPAEETPQPPKYAVDGGPAVPAQTGAEAAEATNPERRGLGAQARVIVFLGVAATAAVVTAVTLAWDKLPELASNAWSALPWVHERTANGETAQAAGVASDILDQRTAAAIAEAAQQAGGNVTVSEGDILTAKAIFEAAKEGAIHMGTYLGENKINPSTDFEYGTLLNAYAQYRVSRGTYEGPTTEFYNTVAQLKDYFNITSTHEIPANTIFKLPDWAR